jgi:SAM-dependent methyltransferase
MSDQHGTETQPKSEPTAGEHGTRHTDLFDYDAELRLHNELFRAAARVGSHDRVLDIGCGTGQSTREAARAAVAGSAVGVDLSARMLGQDACPFASIEPVGRSRACRGRCRLGRGVVSVGGGPRHACQACRLPPGHHRTQLGVRGHHDPVDFGSVSALS